MITLHYYLDARAVSEGSPAPLKLVICRRSASAMLKTGIALLPSEWDAHEQKVVGSPRRKVLNSALSRLKLTAEDLLLPMLYDGRLAGLSVTQIRDIVAEHLEGEERHRITMQEVGRLFEGTGATATIHANAMKRCAAVMGDGWDIPADSVTEEWAAKLWKGLTSDYAATTAATTIGRLRVSWHMAEEKGLVRGNPFAKIRIPNTKTRSRDLSRDEMRLFLTAPSDTEAEAKAVAFFSLSFYLNAMNSVDIWKARTRDVFNGRIMYTRSKTGKDYSVKVIPEAREIIEEYGRDGLLFDYSNYKNITTVTSVVNTELAKRAKRLGIPHRVSMYWARHTFASLAYELGVSIELVSAALGHSYGAAVTMGYVDVKQRQVDEVQRRIVDCVLGK